MAVLHTDPATLPRSALDAESLEGLARVHAAQTVAPETGRWEGRPGAPVLTLEGLQFVPDHEAGRTANAIKIVGGIALLFGVVFLGITLDGDQAEPWMLPVGAILVGLGGATLSHARKKARELADAPLWTGLYLFEDAIVQVTSWGCRVLPAERVQGFEYRESADSSLGRLGASYVDDGGAVREVIIHHRDLGGVLGAWLARTRAR